MADNLYKSIFIPLLLLYSAFQTKAVFIDKVLNDYNIQGAYVAIKIRQNNTTDSFVIRNSALYSFYSQNYAYSKMMYKNLLTQKYKRGEAFRIDSVSLLKSLNLVKVTRNDTVDKYFNLGKTALIRHYFKIGRNCRYLFSPLPRNEENSLIFKLFLMEIYCHTDDETGFLIIPYNG